MKKQDIVNKINNLEGPTVSQDLDMKSLKSILKSRVKISKRNELCSDCKDKNWLELNLDILIAVFFIGILLIFLTR